MFQNNLLMAAASISDDAAYTVDYSCRFNSAEGTRLTRTFDSGNTKTYSYSFWVKRSTIGSGTVDDMGLQTSSVGLLQFGTDGVATHDLLKYVTEGGESRIYPSMLFRDPGAWYHILVTMDTTASNAVDRMVIYINGQRQTSLQTTDYPAEDMEASINSATAHTISVASTNGLDGIFLKQLFLVDQL